MKIFIDNHSRWLTYEKLQEQPWMPICGPSTIDCTIKAALRSAGSYSAMVLLTTLVSLTRCVDCDRTSITDPLVVANKRPGHALRLHTQVTLIGVDRCSVYRWPLKPNFWLLRCETTNSACRDAIPVRVEEWKCGAQFYCKLSHCQLFWQDSE